MWSTMLKPLNATLTRWRKWFGELQPWIQGHDGSMLFFNPILVAVPWIFPLVAGDRCHWYLFRLINTISFYQLSYRCRWRCFKYWSNGYLPTYQAHRAQADFLTTWEHPSAVSAGIWEILELPPPTENLTANRPPAKWDIQNICIYYIPVSLFAGIYVCRFSPTLIVTDVGSAKTL